MVKLPKARFDPAKLTTAYGVLGGTLVVIEGLLAAWLYQATDSTERVFLGSFMVLMILAVIVAVVVLQRVRSTERIALKIAESSQEIRLESDGASEQQISHPDPEMMGAPDGSYMIAQPPAGWSVRETTLAELISEQLATDEAPLNESHFPKIGGIRLFESDRKIHVTPILGKTTINGRKLPLILTTELNSRLAVMPIQRLQPPFYFERPLVHNAFSVMVSMIIHGQVLVSTSAGNLPRSEREVFVAEFTEDLRHVRVGHKEVEHLTTTSSVIAIEGDVFDYVLLLRHVYASGQDDPASEQEARALASLVESFKPLTVPDAEAKKKEIRYKADQHFEDLISETGQAMFFGQLGIALRRLKLVDLSQVDGVARAIRQLKPFRELAEDMAIKESELNDLWKSIDQADEGNLDDLRAVLPRLIESAALEAAPSAPTPAIESREES